MMEEERMEEERNPILEERERNERRHRREMVGACLSGAFLLYVYVSMNFPESVMSVPFWRALEFTDGLVSRLIEKMF